MNFGKHLLFLFFFFIVNAEYVDKYYDNYQLVLADCISKEKEKLPLLPSDISWLSEQDFEYLIIIKHIRVQICSSDEEFRALRHDLVSHGIPENMDSLQERYMSFYLSVSLIKLSEESLSRLEYIDQHFSDKSFEVDMIYLWDTFHNNKKAHK